MQTNLNTNATGITKYIKVGDREIMPVVDIYAYIYEGGIGKQVLRITVDPGVAAYEELFEMFNGNNLPISEYWEEIVQGEDGELHPVRTLKTEHLYYSKNYSCSYNTDSDIRDVFSVEITRKTAAELQAIRNQSSIDATNLALVGMYEMI